MKAILIKDFVKNPDEVFNRLYNELDWKRYSSKPRKEYYCNDNDVPYSYGRSEYADTYFRSPYTDDILAIRSALEKELGVVLDVCFLNLYEDASEHIGWHADDSPEMDPDRPIVTVSLGAVREIFFKERPDARKDKTVDIAVSNAGKKPDFVILENGSACIMPAGMQNTHLHKIPKNDKPCGPRISLTFRGYKKASS